MALDIIAGLVVFIFVVALVGLLWKAVLENWVIVVMTLIFISGIFIIAWAIARMADLIVSS